MKFSRSSVDVVAVHLQESTKSPQAVVKLKHALDLEKRGPSPNLEVTSELNIRYKL